MTLRLIGAIMIIAGCGGFGFSMAAACRREERDLRQLHRALEYMSCELSYRMTPLPQLCRNAANSVPGKVSETLMELALALERQLAPDAAGCMELVLSKQQPSAQLHRLFSELGATLGRFDLPGQIRGLDSAIREAESALRDHRENRVSRIRSYQTLSLCAGAALAILFL